jgi:predicted aspartyl protease
LRVAWGILAGVLWCAHAVAQACTLARVAELPFTVQRSHLVVHGKINGNDARLIFDTGAATTFLFEPAIGRLNLHSPFHEDHGTDALGSATGIGGDASARLVEAKTLDFGGLRAHNFSMLVTDSRIGTEQDAPDGLMSSDMLAKYDIDLDFQGQRIHLFYPTGDCSHPAAYLHGNLYQLPMLSRSADASPRIEVQIGATALIAVLDTGAPFSAISPSAAAQAHLKPDAGDRGQVIGGIGPATVRAAIVTVPAVDMGDLEFQNTPLRITPLNAGQPDDRVDMILGLDFLTRLHPWLSFSSKTFIFQFPPVPSPGDNATPP